MSERDPLEVLAAVAELPETPAPEFGRTLLEDLLADLNAIDGLDRESVTVMEPVTSPLPTPRRLLPLLVGAAAITLVITASLIALFGRDRDKVTTDLPAQTTTTTPSPEGDGSQPPEVVETTAPPSPIPVTPTTMAPTVSVDLARSLLDALGGPEALTVAVIAERGPWNAVTFDPLNNDRVLTADLNFNEISSPELHLIEDGEVSSGPIPWIEADQPRGGGLFQRDGNILADPGFGSSRWRILTNDGRELVSIVRSADFPPVLVASQGDRVAALSTGASQCPYETVNIGSDPLAQAQILDDRDGAFARVVIPEPNVVLALPYFPEREVCEAALATEAQAWDLITGEPLPDYPLNGMAIARAAVSGDGGRAIVLNPSGSVSVLSMETGQAVAELNPETAAGLVFNPLALNQNGTVAAVAEATGVLSVWHVDSETLLFEVGGDPRPGASGLAVAPGLAYDGTRAAVLDDSAGSWTVISLDPNDWLRRACEAGFEPDPDQLATSGLDADAGC